MILDGGVMAEVQTIRKYKINHCVSCPECKAVFGYEMNGGKYLRIGRVSVLWLEAVCDCGNVVHWGSSDRHLKKILKGR